MKIKIRVKNEALFHNDIIIEKPTYMSDQELGAHINDADKALGGSYNFEQFLSKLEDMGFEVIETISDFVTSKDQARAKVIQISEVKDI